MCNDWAILSWLTSASIFSGMAVGRANTSSSRRVWERMPPSVTPSGSPHQHQGDVHLHLLVLLHVDEVGVEHLPGQRVLLVVLEQHQPLRLSLQLEGEQGVELVRGGNGLLHLQRVHRDVGRGLEVAAVDHGGNQSLGAQPAGNALSGTGAGLAARVLRVTLMAETS